MKTKIFLFFLATSFIISLTSCDKNNGKAKEIAEQFITAINDGDKAAVFEIFPQLNEFENLEMATEIKGEDRSVEKDEESGNYIVTVDKKRNQRLVFGLDSIGDLHMLDTYGVFHLDSLSNELALRTGVPQKKISDIEQAKLLKPDSYYMQYLKELPAVQDNMMLTASSGAYSWRTGVYSYVRLNFSVTNNGSITMPGSDYYLLVDIKQRSTGNTISNQKTVDGIDIAPGESREFNVAADECIRYATNRDISYYVTVKYRCESEIEMLLDYGKFNGKEYDEYISNGKEIEYMLRDKGVQVVAKSPDETVVYVHESADPNSIVTDTLYHRQQFYTTYDDTAKWVKAYTNDYKYMGYVKAEEKVTTDELSPVWAYEVELYSEDSSDVPIYGDEKFKGEPVKTYKAGSKVYAAYDSEVDATAIYEKTAIGGMKRIGFIKNENMLEEEPGD